MDFYRKMRRAHRRDKTLVIAKRRRDEHLARNHFDATTGLTQVDCVCELSNTFFAKRTAFGCNCRKRTKGRPKVASGLCDIGAREHVLQFRRETRILRTDAITGRGFQEPETKRWPGTKTAPRVYTLQKRRVSRKGEPGEWWTELRAYRTEQARDNALESLQKGVRCYTWPGYRTRETEYTGPMYEFRVGPEK